MRGHLLVFEGGEGSGKSTQLQRLRHRLERAGVAHSTFREPGGTTVGDQIRHLLLHADHPLSPAAEAALFIASRAELVETMVKPALAAGQVVLLDRFLLSTYAYQMHGRGLPEEEVRAANRLATAGLVPDLTLMLQVPVATGLARAGVRGAVDRMERSDRAFHDRVIAAFDLFATTAWQEVHPECGPIIAIDGRGDAQEVERAVLGAVGAAMPGLLPAEVAAR